MCIRDSTYSKVCFRIIFSDCGDTQEIDTEEGIDIYLNGSAQTHTYTHRNAIYLQPMMNAGVRDRLIKYGASLIFALRRCETRKHHAI